MMRQASERILISLILCLWLPDPAATEEQADPTMNGGKSKSKEHTPTHTNRLSLEKSPYLLQHQHNPVDWFPWGEEAFEKARRENKPILLSIGYSTCHWCHVMERESFEDATTAEVMNEHFVCIKVDREERPDVDKIYMTFVQARTGSGGWPLNVFLTPDLQPFYGGTYYPPKSSYGRPSWINVLKQLSNAWDAQEKEIVASAKEIHRQLEAYVAQSSNPDETMTQADLENAVNIFKKEYDPIHGGFGGAPKFPRPSQPSFLLQQAVARGDTEAIKMVLHTCDKMAQGGLYDHLGGGFARYSVDAKWLVPHFEKMLYDNAQLIHLYLDAYLVSGKQTYADIAHDIIRYIKRDMTHEQGGFYSAEDADSEGKEGKFYCWTKREVEDLLGEKEAELAIRYFGITHEGNFHDHSDPEALPNQNVLSVAAGDFSGRELEKMSEIKQTLFRHRESRVRPHLDDKILASWNGMMLSAIARASSVLNREDYRLLAERNLQFIQSNLWDPETKTLYHRWREGERDSVQLLDAYAHMLTAAVELYQVTLAEKHLVFASDLATSMIKRFYDHEKGGFWQSDGRKDLILRVKEDYDGAEPSGNSVAILGLLKLAAITENHQFRKAAESSIKVFASKLKTTPQGLPSMLSALDYLIEEPHRVVIAGDPKKAQSQALLAATHQTYQPRKVVLSNRGPVEPFALTLPETPHPSAYICTGQACQPPTGDPDALKKAIALAPHPAPRFNINN